MRIIFETGDAKILFIRTSILNEGKEEKMEEEEKGSIVVKKIWVKSVRKKNLRKNSGQ